MPATWEMIKKYGVTWRDIEALGLTWGELDNLSEQAIIDIAKQRIERFKDSNGPIEKTKIIYVQQACQTTKELEPPFYKKAVSRFGLKLIEKLAETVFDNRSEIVAAIIKIAAALSESELS